MASTLWAQLGWADSYGEAERDTETRPRETDELEEGPVGQAPLSAGGLQAPSGDLDANKSPSETEKALDKADRDDAGRGLEYFWIGAEVGPQFFDLAPFRRGSILEGRASESAGGVSYGAGAGLRLLYFTLGARFRRASLASYDLWTLQGELGGRLPLGHYEPFVRFGLGYIEVESLSGDGATLAVSGISGRVSGGISYYLSDSFSVGLELALDYAWLERAAVAAAALESGVASPFTAASSSFALGAGLLAQVGFHF